MSMIRRHPILAYFGFAFLFSWLLAGAMIARYHGLIAIPATTHYLIAWGPALAAVLVTSISTGRAGLRDLLRRTLHWRLGARHWLLAATTPLLFLAIAVLISRLVTGDMPALAKLGKVDYLGDIGVPAAMLVWLFSFGLGEEIGWRGFAQHHLQTQRGLLASAVIIGVLWACWHIPYFFYKDTFIEMGLAGFPFYALNMILGAILLGWLYSQTHSTLAVGVWHGLFDFATAAAIDGGVVAMVIGGLVVAWAIAIIWHEQRRSARQKAMANSL